MRSKIGRLWEQGYLYAAISLALALAFALSPGVGILDWKKEIAYFDFTRTSVTTYRSLPWFWWNKPAFLSVYPAADYSSSFIANPETGLFSPFTPLLLILEAVPYIKLLTVLHSLIGIAGCFALKSRLRWGASQFRVYLILSLLSPLIVQHLAVGYTPWLNLYFFPWLVFFMADETAVRRVFGTAAVIALALLQGGSHVAFWFVLLLVMCALGRAILDHTAGPLLEAAAAAFLTALLSLVRLYATIPVYGGFRQVFAAGYEPLSFLFWSVFPPLLTPPLAGLLTSTVWAGVPAWDAGLFWGFALVMLVVLIRQFSRPRGLDQAARQGPLVSSLLVSIFIAALVLLALSFGSLFPAFIRSLSAVVPVSLLEAAEKYPFRLALPAFLGLSVVIAEHTERIWATLVELGRKAGSLKPTLVKGVGLLLVLALAALILGLILSWTAAANGYPSSLPSWTAAFLRSDVPILAGLTIAVLMLWFAQAILSGSESQLEAALGIPFILASILWLSVGVSVPTEKYRMEAAFAPNILVAPVGSRVKVTADPHELVLLPVEGAVPTQYMLPRINPRDLPRLVVASDNALMTAVDGRITLTPLAPGPIVIAVNTRGYKAAGVMTVIAWIVWVFVMMASRMPRLRGGLAGVFGTPSG